MYAPGTLSDEAATGIPPRPGSGCGGRHRARRLHCLVALDRRARVEEHALASQAVREPGAAHDLEHAGVQPHEPEHGAALGRERMLFNARAAIERYKALQAAAGEAPAPAGS